MIIISINQSHWKQCDTWRLWHLITQIGMTVHSNNGKEARKQHLTFSLRPKHYGLIPRSLYVSPLVNSREGREIAQRTSRRFLMACISQNVREIRELEHDKLFQQRQLEFKLRPQHVAALKACQEVPRNQMTAECKCLQKKKEIWHLAGTIHGRILCQPPVRLCVIRQGLYPSLIITAIHHHSDDPFVSWGDDNGIILL